MKVVQLTLGQLDTNCYLVGSDQTNECYIIDPADSGETINQKILELGWRPQAILLTHGHFDHALALLELKTAWNIPIYLHPADNDLLSKANQTAKHFLGSNFDPVPKADLPLNTENEFSLGNEQLNVIHTPGHTPGSVIIFNQDYIFSGDTLFSDGVGSTQHTYSNLSQLKKSVAEIALLPTTATVASGHGLIMSLDAIKKTWLNDWLATKS